MWELGCSVVVSHLSTFRPADKNLSVIECRRNVAPSNFISDVDRWPLSKSPTDFLLFVIPLAALWLCTGRLLSYPCHQRSLNLSIDLSSPIKIFLLWQKSGSLCRSSSSSAFFIPFPCQMGLLMLQSPRFNLPCDMFDCEFLCEYTLKKPHQFPSFILHFPVF